MNSIFDWGISVIKAVQTIATPALTSFISVVTQFGDVGFFLPVVLILYWCVNQKKAFALTVVILLSTNINLIIKHALKIPRPFMRDSSVKIGFDPTWSTPSAHSQMTAALWGTAAVLCSRTTQLRRRLLWIAAFTMPVIVGFTRVYLGVHYPTDVLFGWALGAAAAAAAYVLMPVVTRYIVPLPAKAQILIITMIAYMCNMACPQEPEIPGLFFGFAGGFILLQHRGGYNAGAGSITQKILRVITGSACIAVLYFAFRLIPIEIVQTQARLITFSRYVLSGCAVSYIAPRLFLALHLAEPEPVNTEPSSGDTFHA